MSATAASSASSDTQNSQASSITSIIDLGAESNADTPGNLRSNHKPATEPVIPIFWLLLAFRIFNAFAVRTFFQPDEYFQALEPAWQIAFGRNSGAWMTWEWKHQLRSTLHPYLFAAVYSLADRLCLTLNLGITRRSDLLLAAPKVFQALLAAAGDFYTWKLGGLMYGEGSLEAWFVLLLMTLNPFHFFVVTRTLSNCMELVLTTVALFLWFTSSPEALDSEALERSRSSTGSSTPELLLHARQSVRDTDSADHTWLSVAKSTGMIKAYVASSIGTYDLYRLRLCLVLAATACVLRITNLLTWLVVASFEFVDYRTAWYLAYEVSNLSVWVPWTSIQLRELTRAHYMLIREAVACGGVVLLAAFVLDRTYYGTWTFPPLHFLHFNITEGISNFYGVHDYTWYFSQGIPLLMGAFMIFLIKPIRQHLFHPPTDSSNFAEVMKYEFTALVLAVPLMFSFVAHKEVRFIYPLLPILHVLAAGSAAEHFGPIVVAKPFSRYDKSSLLKYFILFGVTFANVLAAAIITQYHQCASLSVMTFLRNEHETLYNFQPPSGTGLASADTTMTVGFLMPCHSTPWRSHLIYPDIKAWALGCEPPIGLSSAEKQTYRDEADRFYDDPTGFLSQELGPPPKAAGNGFKHGFGLHGGNGHGMAWNGQPGRKPWPEYLVFFAEKEQLLLQVLERTDYVPCWRAWNSWFHDDWRRRGDIVVMCHRRKPLVFSRDSVS